MHQINLNDQLYQEARRRAVVAGFDSVDDYVAEVLTHDFQLEAENFDHFFTPERLALIDRSAADIAAGNVFTSAQAEESLARSREAWLRDHASGK